MNKLNHDHVESPHPSNLSYQETYIKLAKSRSIFLAEDVTKEVASSLSALLLYYDNESHDEITLYIHSNGGDASALASMYDVMQMIKSPVKTVCIGKAYSAGAVLLAAGSAGNRYALKNAKVMIHGIQCGFPIPGFDITNSKNYYDFLEDHNDNIMKMLAHHTSFSLQKVKDDCKRDLFLDAKQALNYNIIDHIIP